MASTTKIEKIEAFIEANITVNPFSINDTDYDIYDNDCEPDRPRVEAYAHPTVTFRGKVYAIQYQTGGSFDGFSTSGVALLEYEGDYTDWTIYSDGDGYQDLINDLQNAVEKKFGVEEYDLDASKAFAEIRIELSDLVDAVAQPELDQALADYLKDEAA